MRSFQLFATIRVIRGQNIFLLFSRPFAYFAGKLTALRGQTTHTPHIANIGIEPRTEKCKNPRAGAAVRAPDLALRLFENISQKVPVAQCGICF